MRKRKSGEIVSSLTKLTIAYLGFLALIVKILSFSFVVKPWGALNDCLYLCRRHVSCCNNFFLSLSSDLLFVLMPQSQESLGRVIYFIYWPSSFLFPSLEYIWYSPKAYLLSSIPNVKAPTMPFKKGRKTMSSLLICSLC